MTVHGFLGRRGFLKLLGVTGASISLSPSSAIELDEDLYTNHALRISLRKPRNWLYLSIVDYERKLDRQEQDPEYSERFKELRELGGPSLVCGKYSLDYDGLCPTLGLAFDPPDDGPSLRDDLEGLEEGLEYVYGPVDLDAPVRFFELCGFEAAEVGFRFEFREGGQTHRCHGHYLAARTRRTDFTVWLGGTAEGPDSVRDDWPGVRDSIELW